MRTDLATLLKRRSGHFRLESGHHEDLWLDLESLCSRPSAVRRLAAALAARLGSYGVEVICGPLVEGAFVGLLVAEQMDLDFVYSAGQRRDEASDLFPVAYRIPEVLRGLRNRRVAIVNDVINGGSAVRGTLEDLNACGAKPVAIATLLTLGERPAQLAEQASLPLETLEAQPNTLWTPAQCPLCAKGIRLTDLSS